VTLLAARNVRASWIDADIDVTSTAHSGIDELGIILDSAVPTAPATSLNLSPNAAFSTLRRSHAAFETTSGAFITALAPSVI